MAGPLESAANQIYWGSAASSVGDSMMKDRLFRRDDAREKRQEEMQRETLGMQKKRIEFQTEQEKRQAIKAHYDVLKETLEITPDSDLKNWLEHYNSYAKETGMFPQLSDVRRTGKGQYQLKEFDGKLWAYDASANELKPATAGGMQLEQGPEYGGVWEDPDQPGGTYQTNLRTGKVGQITSPERGLSQAEKDERDLAKQGREDEKEVRGRAYQILQNDPRFSRADPQEQDQMLKQQMSAVRRAMGQSSSQQTKSTGALDSGAPSVYRGKKVVNTGYDQNAKRKVFITEDGNRYYYD